MGVRTQAWVRMEGEFFRAALFLVWFCCRQHGRLQAGTPLHWSLRPRPCASPPPPPRRSLLPPASGRRELAPRPGAPPAEMSWAAPPPGGREAYCHNAEPAQAVPEAATRSAASA